MTKHKTYNKNRNNYSSYTYENSHTDEKTIKKTNELTKNNKYKRGDVYYAELSPGIGSEQSGMRPVVIIQNDIGNTNSPTLIIAPVSSTIKAYMPTHVDIPEIKKRKSCCLLEQIRTIDKSRIRSRLICRLKEDTLHKLDEAIGISIGIKNSN